MAGKKKKKIKIKRPGALTRKAAAAGESKEEWAEKHKKGGSAVAREEANFYLNFAHKHKHKGKKGGMRYIER